MMESQQEKFTRAKEELKRSREELRAKISLIGKDAGDVLKDAEDLAKLIEAKLTMVGEAAMKETQAAVAVVREKLQKVVKEIERRARPEKKPVEPVATAKM